MRPSVRWGLSVERRRRRFVGRVQGVGFRWFCEAAARRAGLRGWVRNDPDGGVTLEAEGSAPALDDFLRCVRAGPPGARVDGVETDIREPRNDPREGFGIR